MTLRGWIEKTGRDKAQKILKASRVTISQWASLHCLPTSKRMVQIVKATRGKVTYREMIEDFANKNKK